ncbi:MAG: pantetheine-phosphate adenylyltransferase [Peptococcaceae bacterium]|nr:pantetheine-phosphate adenylyltransferase [Peptococcaceae bacterium]
MRTAIYPASFDPVTNGHIDIIERAAALFDRLVVALAQNAGKTPLFTFEERLDMLQELLRDYKNVEVAGYNGLTVDFARSIGACVIIRGLRAISDFEYEFMMSLTNQKLAPGIETVFLMTKAQNSFISSSAVKEVAYYGGCLQDLVPPLVAKALVKKYKGMKDLSKNV